MDDSLDRAVFVAGVLCVACAPWSWVDDGVTPSWVVFPLFVAAGLWRLTQGKGRLWLAITATVFVLVHVPWTWVALSGGEHPTNADADVNAVQWFVTLLVGPGRPGGTGLGCVAEAAPPCCRAGLRRAAPLLRSPP